MAPVVVSVPPSISSQQTSNPISTPPDATSSTTVVVQPPPIVSTQPSLSLPTITPVATHNAPTTNIVPTFVPPPSFTTSPTTTPSPFSAPFVSVCPYKSYTVGTWQYHPETVQPYNAPSWEGKCDENHDPIHNSSQIREPVKYIWTPNHCTLIPFSYASMCRALNGCNLLMIGDSLTLQQVASFYGLMNTVSGRICHEFGTPSLIQGTRNDHLTLVTSYNSSYLEGAEYPFLDQITTFNYDIIVINTGIHIVDTISYATYLTTFKQYFDTNYPNITIIFRASLPGHFECWLKDKPYHEFDINYIRSPLYWEHYRWEQVPERNRIAASIFPHFLDVYSMTVLRPDGHQPPRDCIHYCQPGPIDTWNYLLMNYLLKQIS